MTITPAAINFTSDYETIDLELKLLTPMFGGGVAAHEAGNSNDKRPDFVTPIRGTAVRGALRHWWRATTGAWFKTLDEMALQEGVLFGTIRETSKQDAERLGLKVSRGIDSLKTIPSQLTISIDCARLGTSLESGARPFKEMGAGESYGAFPLNGDRGEAKKGSLYHASTPFDFSVRYPKRYKEQVKLALSAFVHFGGVGGRTTRGFGQLAETSHSGKLYTREELFKAIEAQGKPAIGDQVGAIQPSLYINVLDNSSSLDNLNSALGWLREFRQGMLIARDTKEIKKPNGKTVTLPARSHWPEPDSIRRLTNNHSEGHKPRHPLKHVFPRARFGLPIITKFKDDQRGDPQTTILSPANRRQNQQIERMRSPLQISVHDGAYSYLVLSAPDARTFDLKLDFAVPSKGRQQPLPENVQAALPTAEFQNARQVYPILFDDGFDSNKQYDPIIAFLNYVAASTHTPKLR